MLFFLWLAIASNAHAQALIQFSNRIPGILDAPILALDGTNKLEGGDAIHAYQAVLFAGPTADALAPVYPNYMIGSGSNAGYFEANPFSGHSIQTVRPGTVAFCQVRVWDGRRGGPYETVVAEGWEHGESEVFQVATRTDSPVPLVGLKSFKLNAPVLGEIDSGNLRPGMIDAPVFDTDGLTRLSGPGYLVQLYAKIATNQLEAVAIGLPVSFGTGASEGYWDGGNVTLTNMAAGQIAQITAGYGKPPRARRMKPQSAL